MNLVERKELSLLVEVVDDAVRGAEEEDVLGAQALVLVRGDLDAVAKGLEG